MFQSVLKEAQHFTFPVVIPFQRMSGDADMTIGAFFVVNDDGWVITANHILQCITNYGKQAEEVREYREKESAIRNDNSLTLNQKKAKLKRLHKVDPNAVERYMVMWGTKNWSLQDANINKESDLAFGKLRGFQPGDVTLYPCFKNPEVNFDPGIFLCKLGFPFVDMEVSFNNEEKVIDLVTKTFPIPFLPLEGMFVRKRKMSSQPFSVELLETSSPGIPGHSGGPIVDEKGRIWAMQSLTTHYKLAFKNTLTQQYFHSGMGPSSSTICRLLERHGVKFNMSAD